MNSGALSIVHMLCEQWRRCSEEEEEEGKREGEEG